MERTNSNEANDQLQMEDQQLEYTLDEALSAIGFGKLQYIVLAYAGVGWVAESMEILLLSVIGPAIQPDWGISQSQQSLISTIVSIGMLIGAYSWGVVSDSYGRKKGFLWAAIIVITAGILSAFTTNYIFLLILRCFVGIGLGCGHVFLSWLLEFVPIPNRGTWMVLFTTFWTVGSILEALLAWWIMPRYGWRWLLGLSAIPSFLSLVFYPFVPESPRYLYTKGRVPEAIHILQKGAQLNKKLLPKGQLVPNNQIEVNLPSSVKNNPIINSIRNLLSPEFIKTTLLLWLLYFANAFSYYGIILLTSQLSIGQPGSVIMDDSLYENLFITSFSDFAGLPIAACIVDKVGRKTSMKLMIFSGFILLSPLVFHQNPLLTTCFLFGTRMFISASFIVAHVYAPEVYPTNLRATGVGIAVSVGRIGGIVCSLIPAVIGGSGCCQPMVSVILYEVTILLLGLSVVFLPFETKGRVLEDNTDSPTQPLLLPETTE